MRLLLITLFFCFTSFTQDTVLICTSKASYAYHDDYCRGLKQCKQKVKKITKAEAVKIKRKPCGYCY